MLAGNEQDCNMSFVFLGEFGWISKPGGVVRITKYTADRQGYRVRHITRQMKREKEKGGTGKV